MRFAAASSFSFGVFALACATRPAGPAVGRSESPSAAAASAGTAATLIVSTADAPFVRSVLEPSSNSGAPSGITLTVDLSQRRQAVTSFGGAFNEQGWQALAALNPVDREAALRALFDREIGLGFDYCRVPIGASDYAIDRYTLDESPADYQMAHFSIERDQQRLIPYLKAARRVRPDLKFWASAWTPPTWMKTPATFDGGAFKDDPAIYGAYALYLARFVESYAEQGLPISMVVPQNEPQTLTHYPSCDWTPAQYVKFLRDYAGPLFKQRGLNTQLFVGTINFESWDLSSVLRAPGVAQYVSGVAIQWGGIAHAADIRASWPELPIMQSETECGNNPGEPGFNPDHAANDFSYAAHTWRKLRDFFRAGASSYMLWNMVLDEQGKNLDSPRPWPQNSAIVVDRRNKRVIYTPMFWATKHFSRLVARGGRLVRSDSAYEDQVVFLNPDGTVVVELSNTSNAIVSLNVAVDGYSRAITLPPRSFASLLLPPA